MASIIYAEFQSRLEEAKEEGRDSADCCLNSSQGLAVRWFGLEIAWFRMAEEMQPWLLVVDCEMLSACNCLPALMSASVLTLITCPWHPQTLSSVPCPKFTDMSRAMSCGLHSQTERMRDEKGTLRYSTQKE